MPETRAPWTDYTFAQIVESYAKGALPAAEPATREQALEIERDRLRKQVEAQAAAWKELAETNHARAVVLDVYGEYVVIDFGGNLVEVRNPKRLNLAPGDAVRVHAATAGIVDRAPAASAGNIHPVSAVVDERLVEVQIGNVARVVRRGRDAVEAGDRVVLDAGGYVVVRNLGKPTSPGGASATEVARVEWTDVVAQEEAVREAREAVEDAVRHRALYESVGKRPPRGILLAGPPGVGKTLLGRAMATAIADLHGASSRESGFLYVKGPELLNKYVGQSEENVRAVFAAARRHAAEHGYPAVVFLDECESLLSKRDGVGTALSGVAQTLVPMFLAEMDGLSASSALVVLATNRPESLDPAAIRDGRVDARVLCRRPDKAGARAIALHYLRGVATEEPAEELAAELAAELFAPRHVLGVARSKHTGGDVRVILGHAASGALVRGIVDRAALLAIRRAKGAGDATARVRFSDVHDAVALKRAEALVAQTGAEAEEVLGGALRAYEPVRE
jgi:proteasome-associated ATPase